MDLFNYRKPRIIVCGDIMIDHSITVKIEKIANEAPIPVYTMVSDEYNLGGCGNVLTNLHSLGCDTLHIFSAIGCDENGSILTRLVSSMDISNHMISVNTYNTTVKRRYFCDNKIMFRCDIENSSNEKGLLEPLNFYEEFEHILATEKIDCIILSDYSKGFLTFDRCQTIIKLANKYGVFTCVDPKDNPAKYAGCSLIKPNRSEAYKLFKMDRSAPILDVHKEILKTIGCRYSVITMSENGITLYDGKRIYHEIPEIHKIIDVTGAGDVVCSMIAYFIWNSNIDVDTLLRITTGVATRSVEFPGTYTITQSDIHLNMLQRSKIIDHSQLARIHDIYSDKKIAFTNGCFDLLHRGHIETFIFCKRKGDIVVVGVNSDDSIRRLKGPTRPIHPLATRLAVLSAVMYIDYIIVFDEDTPYNILRELRPYYLVKGADYRVENVIGREFAKEVLLCELVEGVSTTNTVRTLSAIAPTGSV